MTVAELGAAYGAAASVWAGGPERLYGVLAATLLDRAPRPLTGRRVADVGAGTGVATRALAARGAVPYGVDVSLDMLRHGGAARPPGVVADAVALPFRTASLGGTVFAFSLNHLSDPVTALREARRAVCHGGVVLGAVFAAANRHPAKAQVESVLIAHGWRPPDWYRDVKDVAEPRLASSSLFAAAAAAAGLTAVDAVEAVVEVGIQSPADLAAWRLGMAHVAPYLMSLAVPERAALVAAATAAVTAEPLRPRVVLLAALVP